VQAISETTKNPGITYEGNAILVWTRYNITADSKIWTDAKIIINSIRVLWENGNIGAILYYIIFNFLIKNFDITQVNYYLYFLSDFYA
jgi:hypothetical protein